MPSAFSTPILASYRFAGALTTGVTVYRKPIPFDHQVLGAMASANTAPTTSSIILDVLHCPNGGAIGSGTSLWNVSCGASGTAIGTVTGCTYAAAGVVGYTAVTVSTTASGSLKQGQRVLTASIGGITAANGTVYVASVGNGNFTFLTSAAVSGTYSSGGSIYPPDNRPTILATNTDQAAIAAGVYDVAPLGTDPNLSGQTGGVETVYPVLDEFPYLSPCDANPTGYGFAGSSPIQEGNVPTIAVNTTESGSANQLVAPVNQGYNGKAGDTYTLKVTQVGSGTAGSDVELTLVLIQL